jgi:hypothetical protein
MTNPFLTLPLPFENQAMLIRTTHTPHHAATLANHPAILEANAIRGLDPIGSGRPEVPSITYPKFSKGMSGG